MNHIVTRPSGTPDTLETSLDFILLDGSGSMTSKWWPMLSAIDTYVAELRSQQVDTHLLLHIFDDTDLQLVGRNTHIRDWRDFVADPIGAHFGTTPLYDAIVLMGREIQKLNPQKGCRILIVTDGGDTGNTFASLPQALSVLDWLRAQSFQITFMGCDFNNLKQAKALGANAFNTIGVRKEKLTEATHLLGQRAARHSRTGEDIHFSEGERQAFGGYLSAPEK